MSNMSGTRRAIPGQVATSGLSRVLSVLRALAMLALAGAVAVGAGCAVRGPAGAPGDGASGSPAPEAGSAPGSKPAGPAAAPRPAAPLPARLAAAAPGAAGAGNQCLADIEDFAERHTGSRVMLGEAAFASSDRLVLTRAAHAGSDGRPLDGRAAMPQPVVLNLVAGPGGCSVRLAEAADGAAATGSAAPLPACTCAPLSP